MAGETLDDAVHVARRLNDDGYLISLDLLGEEVHDRTTARAAVDSYLESLDRIDSERLKANISIKPTQLGLAIDEGLAFEGVERLGARAAEVGTTVTIDMEDSRYTEATIQLFEKGQATTGNFGIALQSYLRRTPNDLARLIPLGGHIRLCKGAYVEPEDVALQAKSGVDAAYARQLRALMDSPTTKPAIATHDPHLLDLARELASERDEPFEFQMLFGVRPDLQRQLIGEGLPLRVYLPFGSQWYPYLTRRLAERPANAWFFARALLKR
ncbi:MAG: proline dehydrogenase family protein [Acidimicrobiia bacterium]